MSVLIQFAIGLTFGLGLVIAGMSDPAKILNFLDLAGIASGRWDPSLAFVLLGAIGVTFVGYKIVLQRKQPLIGDKFHIPNATELDRAIIVGPALFGIGWGLAGFCPGPALTALGSGQTASLLFVATMGAGMALARRLATPSPALAHAPQPS